MRVFGTLSLHTSCLMLTIHYSDKKKRFWQFITAKPGSERAVQLSHGSRSVRNGGESWSQVVGKDSQREILE